MHRDPSGYAFSKDLAIWFLRRCAYVLFNRHFCWKQNFPPTEINWSKKISRFERERVNHHRSGKIKNLICRLGFDADFLKSYSIVKYRKLRDAYRLFKRRIKTFRDLTRQHEGYKNVRRRPNTLEGWTVLLILFFLLSFYFFFSLRIRAIGPTLDAKLSNLRWIISSTRICDCTDANKCTRPWQLTLNFE